MNESQLPSQRLRDSIKLHCDCQEKGGTAPLIFLTLGTQYYHKDFIEKVLDDIDKIPMRVAVGDEITSLEKLAYQLIKVGCFLEEGNQL